MDSEELRYRLNMLDRFLIEFLEGNRCQRREPVAAVVGLALRGGKGHIVQPFDG